MHAVIDEIYAANLVRDDAGNEYDLKSAVDRAEGELVHQLIASDESIRTTLEIGCAYGLSSLHIGSALSGRDGARHIIIDPFQYPQWHGIGMANLQRAGFDFCELVEEPSELALPAIARTESGTFDLVLIDGWHTFDHTLLDLFYANHCSRWVARS